MDSSTVSQPVIAPANLSPQFVTTATDSQTCQMDCKIIKKHSFLRRVKRLNQSFRPYINIPTNNKAKGNLANCYVYVKGNPIINLNGKLNVKIPSAKGLKNKPFYCRHFAQAFSMKLINFKKLREPSGKAVGQLTNALQDISDTKSLADSYLTLENLYKKHITSTRLIDRCLTLYKLANCTDIRKKILEETAKKISINTADLIENYLERISCFLKSREFYASDNQDMSYYAYFYLNEEAKEYYLNFLKQELNKSQQCLYYANQKGKNLDESKEIEMEILTIKKEIKKFHSNLEVIDYLANRSCDIINNKGYNENKMFFAIAYKFMNIDTNSAWQQVAGTNFKYFSYDNFSSTIYQMCCNTVVPKKTNNFILAAGEHAMSFSIMREEDDSFVIKFYDPNTTLLTTTYLIPSLTDIDNITMDIFNNLETYLANGNITTFSHEDKKNIPLNLIVQIEN